jgi:hypothetical protein
MKCAHCGKKTRRYRRGRGKWQYRKYCDSKCRDKAYYARNREARKKYQRKYQKDNKEKIAKKHSVYFKEWYKRNREKQLKYMKDRYHNDKKYREKIKSNARKQYEDPDYIEYAKARARERYQEQKEELRKKRGLKKGKVIRLIRSMDEQQKVRRKKGGK